MTGDEECVISYAAPSTAPTAEGRLFVRGPSHFAEEIKRWADISRSKAEARENGEPIWWCVELQSCSASDESSRLHGPRSAGNIAKVEGRWRFGSDAMLDIQSTTGDTADDQPSHRVRIIFRSVGPWSGPRAYRYAKLNATRLRDSLIFITDASFELASPSLTVATGPQREEAHELLTNGPLPELGVSHIRLWTVLSFLFSQDNRECYERVAGAMSAYAHALNQRTAAAGSIFLVSALEALTVPNAPWRSERVTKRFEECLFVHCIDVLDKIVADPRCARAFPSVRTRKQLVQGFYGFRSKYVHTGQLGVMGEEIEYVPSVQITFLARLARTAIVRFIKAPFSSLCGHPDLDPSLRLQFTPTQYDLLRRTAKAEGLSIESLVRQRSLGSDDR